MDGLVSATIYSHTPSECSYDAGSIGKGDMGLAKATGGRWRWGLSSTEFARGSFCVSRVPIQIECMATTRAPRFSPSFFDFTCYSHFADTGMQLLVDPTYVCPSPLVVL